MAGLQSVRFHVGEVDAAARGVTAGSGPTLRGIGRASSEDNPAREFNSDEAAARHYLGRLLGSDPRPGLRGLSAPDRPDVVPDLKLIDTREVAQTRTRLVRFEQTRAAIPVFGSLAVVELDSSRELVSASAELAEIAGVSSLARLSPGDAVDRVAEAVGKSASDLAALPAPTLAFYHDEPTASWHLAYYLRRVPGFPKDYPSEPAKTRRGPHGLGRSPRSDRPAFDFLIDAHDGKILLYFSAAPMAAAVPIPCKLQGEDEEGAAHSFWGMKAGQAFEMSDPIRLVRTFDFGFGDIDAQPFPQAAISNPSANLGNTRMAAVSAHVNGTRVFDFYKSVLLRDGIDDRGMELISAVNCTYPVDEPPPEWHNAVWYENRMWYGQVREGNDFRSYARHLDVIAHELTHGVTERTSDLVYKDQSGALNESFSDIFGIVIKNWYRGERDSVAKWDWELGSGLGENGGPLRDLSDPRRTGDPDHMNAFLQTRGDNGGVHTNSNIHNKAAYNVFVSRDQNGAYLFSPKEAATLYYLCLTRLGRTATFSKALEVLLDVARTYYAGDQAELAAKAAALTEAYGKVGIQ
jgi:bacillolysin